MSLISRTRILSLMLLILSLSILEGHARTPLVNSSRGNTVSVKDIKEYAQNKGKPLLVMLWATHCKPCIIEGRIVAAVAKHFENKIHFVGIQVSEGVSLTRKNAKQKFDEIKDKLAAKGVSRDATLPRPYLGGKAGVVWDAFVKGSPRLYKKSMGIPLFALYNREGELVKIWTSSIYHERKVLEEFFAAIEWVVFGGRQ